MRSPPKSYLTINPAFGCSGATADAALKAKERIEKAKDQPGA